MQELFVLKKRPFTLLLLSFIALRLGTLLTAVETVSAYDYEERYRGTIAKELIEGPKVSFWDYQADNYDGGSLWIGAFAVPFFLLLGPNLFALKLVALLFSFAVLILSFLFFKKFFDRTTALLVSAFLVLPPPVFTALSLCAIGSHFESILFSVAMLFSLYQFLYGERHKTISLILLGLVGGLGFWFSSYTFLTLLSCLASWFLLDRRSFLSSRLLVFFGAFGIGLLPLVPYNITHPRGVFDLVSYAFSWDEGNSLGSKLKYFPIRIGTLVSETLPLIFRFRSFFFLSGKLLTGLYGLLVIFLVVPFLWREIRRLFPLLKNSLREGKIASGEREGAKPLPFLLYPFLFILAYGASNYPVERLLSYSMWDFRFFSFFYYVTFSFLALALHKKKRPVLFLTLFLGLGLIGQGSLLFNEPVGRAFRYKGYSYEYLGEVWAKFLFPFPQKFEEFRRVANRFPELERRYLYMGYANFMDFHLDINTLWNPEFILESLRPAPLPYRPYFLESWSASLCHRLRRDFDYPIARLGLGERITSLGESIPEEEKPYFYYGLAKGNPIGFEPEKAGECLQAILPHEAPYPSLVYFYRGRSFYRSLRQRGWNESAAKILNSLPRKEKTWVWRGMGCEATAFWVESITLRNFNPLEVKISSDAQNEFFWGVGWGLLEQVVEDRTRAQDWLRGFPSELQSSAREGMLAFERWRGIVPGQEKEAML